MGYLTVFPLMDASRAFCPGSTGKLANQLLVKDHMVSHYKKIYSAKAAVDCSVPNSMRYSIIYNDQKRREKMTKVNSERTRSQQSIRSNNTASYCSKNARSSARGEGSAHCYSGNSAMSSPRFSTSFHSKQTVYPSQMAASSFNYQPGSELTCRSLVSQKQPFTRSCSRSSSSCQVKVKSFQNPTQKTYSGDLLLKHADRFTQEKPFTPRTLKSDCKPVLLSYRYYTPSNIKGAEGKVPSKCNQQGTDHKSTCSHRRSSVEHKAPMPNSADPECSYDEANVFGHYSTANKYRDYEFFLSSARVSPEGMKSPIMRKVTAEEEELMYLEFITDVTNEIIERGIYTDRVLKRVFEHHIHMNKHRLNKDKMHHLLDALQNELQSPPAAAFTVLEKSESGSLFFPRHECSSLEQKLELLTKDETKCLYFTQSDKDAQKPEGSYPSLYPTTVNSSVSESAGPDLNEDEQALEDLGLDYVEENVKSSSLANNPLNEEENPVNCTDNNELVKQLDELGRNMTESLNVSDIHNSQEQEASIKLSDDEF